MRSAWAHSVSRAHGFCLPARVVVIRRAMTMGLRAARCRAAAAFAACLALLLASPCAAAGEDSGTCSESVPRVEVVGATVNQQARTATTAVSVASQRAGGARPRRGVVGRGTLRPERSVTHPVLTSWATFPASAAADSRQLQRRGGARRDACIVHAQGRAGPRARTARARAQSSRSIIVDAAAPRRAAAREQHARQPARDTG